MYTCLMQFLYGMVELQLFHITNKCVSDVFINTSIITRHKYKH